MQPAGNGAMTLDEVAAAIQFGQPGTFTTAATAFKSASDALKKLGGDVPTAVDAVVTTSSAGPWSGPAADAYKGHSDLLAADATAGSTALAPYKDQVDHAATALTDAQTEVKEWLDSRETYRSIIQATGAAPDESAYDAGGMQIMSKLVTAYRSVIASLTPLPAPGTGTGSGAGGGAGPSAGADAGAPDEGAADGTAPDDATKALAAPPNPGGSGTPPPVGDPGPPALDPPTPPPLLLDPAAPPVADVNLGNPDAPAVGEPTGPGSGDGSPFDPFPGRPPAPDPFGPGTGSGFETNPSGLPALGRTTGDADPGTILTGLPGPINGGPAAPLAPIAGLPSGVGPSGSAGPFTPFLPGVGFGTALTTTGGRRSGPVPVDAVGPAQSLGARGGFVPPMLGAMGGHDDGAGDRGTWLVGDEDWTDEAGDGVIGRPPTTGSDA